MRIPYVVGRWVRGQNHYGRQRLIDYLLTVPDSATWLVGTRRMGKTSLLRQLEYVTGSGDYEYMPLLWDLQGCHSPEDMSVELDYAVADVLPRMQAFGVKPPPGKARDAIDQLRMLSRATEKTGRRLLLLVDEAEALLYVAERNAHWLAKLRKVLQEGNLRSIITSTKLLARLNEVNAAWTTSPFLFGFNLANLWQLEAEPAHALIRQLQAPVPVLAPDDVVDDIYSYTNGHPYLLQHLCQRLFVVDDGGRGTLRPVRDDDLTPDHILSGFFRIDFQYLTEIERKIMLTVAGMSIARTDEIVTAISEESPRRLEMFLYGLRKLGYLRASHDRWTVGNEYMRRWIQDQLPDTTSLGTVSIDDAAEEEILRNERRNEADYLRFEIERLQEELVMATEEAGNRRVDPEAITRMRMELVRARRELDKISGV
jgi:hypothetical protein